MSHPMIKAAVVFVSTTLVCYLTIDLVDARPGGGGRSMSRGGPAASGSFQRSRARPQSGNRQAAKQRPGSSSGSFQDRDQRQARADSQQDRFDNRQENVGRRQENISDRQDFRKEVHDDRKEWYEDRWRRGRYVSVGSWGRVGCANVVYVNGRRYYDCAGVRYERVYRGTDVVYIIVN